MPYLAPEAPIPITSCAPRLAEMNASPVIPGEGELYREIGTTPELDVGAGAVAGGEEAAALDPVAPELVVLDARGAHRGERAPECLAERAHGGLARGVPETAGGIVRGGDSV